MPETIVVVVLTAIATTLVAECARAFWRYIDRRGHVASWSIRGFPPAGFGRFYLIENTGNADAIDVNVTVSGDADYEINAGAPLDVLRPSDTFLVLVSNPGSGSVVIRWEDRKGKSRGPARRALTPS